jgi:hypothetical protein
MPELNMSGLSLGEQPRLNMASTKGRFENEVRVHFRTLPEKRRREQYWTDRTCTLLKEVDGLPYRLTAVNTLTHTQAHSPSNIPPTSELQSTDTNPEPYSDNLGVFQGRLSFASLSWGGGGGPQ